MFCPNCGAEIVSERQKFCVKCGESLAEITGQVQPGEYDGAQMYSYSHENEYESEIDDALAQEDSLSNSNFRVIAVILVILIALACSLPFIFSNGNSCGSGESSLPSSCSQKTFVCDLCGSEERGRPHKAEFLGEECELCDDCYKGLHELSDGLESLF